DAWSDHTTEYDHWVIMGIPSETVNYDGKQSITARVIMLSLTVAEEPIEAGEKAKNQFYAKLIDGAEGFFKDADGMSGGPVFALKKRDDQWRYHVIGVQSAWYRTNKIFVVCPFSSFGLALEEIVAEARASQESA
ncbi:MAG TPA: hypothetical protein VFW00_08865, partial [Rhodocyclaceae bacterium]|nr:hypothetical protein [Rhodocyclaceae bacterium]